MLTRDFAEVMQSTLSHRAPADLDGMTEETSLASGLGLDQASLFLIAAALADRFEIELPEELVDSWSTVGDICYYVQTLRAP